MKLEPEETIRRRAWSIRAKYRSVASEKEYEAYQASNPPDPKTGDLKDLRADTERILDEFHWIYAFAPILEEKRDSLSKLVFWITSVLVVLALMIATIAYFTSSKQQSNAGIEPIPVLPIVIGMGMIGGYVSLQRRIQVVPTAGDPIVSITQISNSRYSVYLAPISGAVFAVLLYLIFIGGLLQGPLFPRISTAPGKCVSFDNRSTAKNPVDSKPAAQDEQGSTEKKDSTTEGAHVKSGTDSECPTTVTMREFETATAPASGVAFAILLVWSFIAGFAERFVPDTIDRLVSQASQKP